MNTIIVLNEVDIRICLSEKVKITEALGVCVCVCVCVRGGSCSLAPSK